MEIDKSYPDIYDSVKRFIPLANEGFEYVMREGNFLQFQKRIRKGPRKSKPLREQGNKLAMEAKYFEAIIVYTDSIRNALVGTGEMMKAYTGRAEALLNLSYYKECLEDCHRAEDNAPPHTPMDQVNNLKRAALKGLDSVTNERPIPELKHRHEWIDCATDCVDLVQSETGRRYFIANRDIAVGELIAVDECLGVGVHVDDKLICHQCGMNCMNPIPCQTCTIVQYCGATCRNIAWIRYHMYECCILRTMGEITEKVSLPLKIALSFKDYRREETDVTQRYDPYKEIINLEVDVSRHHHADILNIQWVTAISFLNVKYYTSFFNDVLTRPSGNLSEEIDNESIFRALLLKLLLIKKTYFRVVNKKSIIKSEALFEGRYDEARLFRSFLKHSCVPNIALVHVDNVLLARAFVPIKKGESLLTAFCQPFTEVPTGLRSIQLQQKGMRCSCEACTNWWPMLRCTQRSDEVRLRKLEMLQEFIEQKRLVIGELMEKVVAILGEIANEKWNKPSTEFYTYFSTARKCYEFIDERKCHLSSANKPCFQIEEVHQFWGIFLAFQRNELPEF